MSTETRQHIIVDDDYHKTVKIIAATMGCDLTEAVQSVLIKDSDFKKKLAEVKRAQK
jgi:hypothetical protein